MFTNKQVNEFCNLEISTNRDAYIKVIQRKKQFDYHAMANQFIFQHAMENTNQFEVVLNAVHEWWERYAYANRIILDC